MPDVGDRLPVRVIEAQCEADALLEELRHERTLRRNQDFAGRLAEVQRWIREANMYTCRAWFADELADDLPPAA